MTYLHAFGPAVVYLGLALLLVLGQRGRNEVLAPVSGGLAALALESIFWLFRSWAGEKGPWETILRVANWALLALAIGLMLRGVAQFIPNRDQRQRAAWLWVLPAVAWFIALPVPDPKGHTVFFVALALAVAVSTRWSCPQLARGYGRTALTTAGYAVSAYLLCWPWLGSSLAVRGSDRYVELILVSWVAVSLLVAHVEREQRFAADAVNRYQALFDSSLLGLLRLSPEGSIVEANASCLEVLACAPSKEPSSILQRFAIPDQRTLLERALDEGRSWSAHGVAWLRDDGQVALVDCALAACRDPHGTFLGLEGVVRDVSRERSLQDQLERAARMDALARMAGGIAHDFNNALAAVIAGVDLARLQVPVDTAARRTLATVRDAAEGASQLTQQLLAMARRQAPLLVPVEVNEAVRGGLRLAGLTSQQAERLHVEMASEALWVQAASGQVDQIVANLVRNAIDATSHGGEVNLRVGLAHAVASAPSTERRVLIEVRDSGAGMDRPTLDRLFDPFFTTKGDAGGSGIGLAAVQAIVQQLCGSIEVASAPGRGSTFHVQLELVVVPDSQRQVARGLGSPGCRRIGILTEDAALRAALISWAVGQSAEIRSWSSPRQALEELPHLEGGVALLLWDVVGGTPSNAELERVGAEVGGRLVLVGAPHAGANDTGRGAWRTLPKPFSAQALVGLLSEDMLPLTEEAASA